MLGFATANLSTDSWTVDVTEDDYGVYCGLVEVRVDEKDNFNEKMPKACVVSIGKNPTFGAKFPAFEVHILEFDGDIYGEEMRVQLFEKMRPMIQFKSIDQLKEQITSDAKSAKTKMQNVLAIHCK
ncbi:Riboflavin kinase [Tritrichomonas foetus]|uniref:riboflavin kinase n=1 Tax=Tritrichomonas foetus TaxID=1144522 RepID=A0A1J4J3C9_9EUKA|nr:Riboflavin kinase [Tritrichomonas foetus]|eukprot:OHS93960.1 Riboflavin kinase [Tritrichomonas foetus]